MLKTFYYSSIFLMLSLCLACAGDSSSSSITAADGAVFRGSDFGNSISKVKANEKGELVKEDRNKLTYTVTVNDDEFADVAYEFNGGKLYKITYNFFANDKTSATSHYKDLVKDCDSKYKEHKAGRIWKGETNDQHFSVFVKQSTSTKSPGLIAVWETL